MRNLAISDSSRLMIDDCLGFLADPRTLDGTLVQSHALLFVPRCQFKECHVCRCSTWAAKQRGANSCDACLMFSLLVEFHARGGACCFVGLIVKLTKYK